ncbi:hypothetical protein EUTSA_v10011968mg [Eutrema salsugineum]|uniref:S-protein homolog n=1 Tax=Eutrema salsugineum TaxID=72664 RepID=V4MFQ7_EUTSA|nr:hypothetical protein EUTSA_v10011968mg [Eutrema salsugineum]
MNRVSCFSFVIVFCVGLGDAGFLDQNSVQFKNSLKPGNILTVRCDLNDDDLGYHDLNPGVTYELRFYNRLFKTKISCAFWQGDSKQKFHQYFRTYTVRIPPRKFKGINTIGSPENLTYTGGLHYGKTNFWDVKEDGI